MRSILLLMAFTFLFLQACEENQKPKTDHEQAEDEVAIQVDQRSDSHLTVKLINNEGEQIGEAILNEGDQGVEISTHVRNLPPSLHGYHIHEYGLCETPTFETAGGHFNPDGKAHGFNNKNGPHAGDLPNLEVEEDGTVKMKYINNRVTLEQGKKHSLRGDNGSSLIIHSDEDDYISQPAGNSGDRIVCGVISEKKTN